MQPSLNLQTGQQLVLTPLMQRAIQFLQLSSLEYCQEVEETATVNPFLEPIEPGEDSAAVAASSTEAATGTAIELPTDTVAADSTEPPAEPVAEALVEGDWADRDWDTRSSRHDGDDQWDPMMNVAEAPTLRSHLMQQAGCLNLPDRDRAIVGAIIEAVAPSGYLDQSLEDIQAVLAAEVDPTIEELRIALRHVQAMDPVGVGARSVPECLMLQLEALPEDEPGRACALKLTEHLDLFAAREFQKLLKVLDCDEQALSDATILIRKLKPHPGSEFGASEAQYVVPDVIVQKVRGRWVARINPQVVPKLRLNHAYANILQGSRDGGEMQIGQQLQEARWLMRNIEQRFTTIQNVAQAILDRQSRYFDYGDVAMKALKLKDIAETLGLHESTVSRITSRKFMATPKGVLEFKHFFNSHVTTAEGQPCSSTAVKSLIRQVIAGEEPGNPLSDIKVTRILEKYGVKVARRTVSKYRDALKIPAVEIRKYSYRPETVN